MGDTRPDVHWLFPLCKRGAESLHMHSFISFDSHSNPLRLTLMPTWLVCVVLRSSLTSKQEEADKRGKREGEQKETSVRKLVPFRTWRWPPSLCLSFLPIKIGGNLALPHGWEWKNERIPHSPIRRYLALLFRVIRKIDVQNEEIFIVMHSFYLYSWIICTLKMLFV